MCLHFVTVFFSKIVFILIVSLIWRYFLFLWSSSYLMSFLFSRLFSFLGRFNFLGCLPFSSSLRFKGVVSSYQIGLILPSVAETQPKMYQSRCNLQFSICRHAGGKALKITIACLKISYLPVLAGHRPWSSIFS